MSDSNAGQLGRKREHCHCAMPFFRQSAFLLKIKYLDSGVNIC